MNSTLFQTTSGRRVPPADARNSHGAPAYRFDARHALAQYAATGCLNDTYYATAEMQLDAVLGLCAEVPPAFIAKTALWTRQKGFMKDLPALLAALLTVEDPALAERVFDRVIDDGKMVRNFVQVLRSGAVGRKSLGSMPRRLVRRWLESRTDEQLFRAQVGASPSLSDVVKLAHPRPTTASRRALYGWLLGRPFDLDAIPDVVRRYEAFRADPSGEPPDVPFQLLTALPLDKVAWRHIALRATWQQLRMNLNTFERHGVFDERVGGGRLAAKLRDALGLASPAKKARRGVVDVLAHKLRDPVEVARARVLPYQLLVAYLASKGRVPHAISDALHDAMEHATANVPSIEGKVYVCPDVSGSMHSPVTGHRAGATTAARCIDVAALVAASVLRKNPDAEVIPFEHDVVDVKLTRRDSVMTNAEKLARIGGGGTSCSAPLQKLNREHARGDLVIFVSDNESWVDARGSSGTAMTREWEAFKVRNPRAKLVCIDIQPNRTTQAKESRDILNVGGFSDAVFEVVSAFAKGGEGAKSWVEVIEQVQL